MSNKYGTPWEVGDHLILNCHGFAVEITPDIIGRAVDCVNACQGMEDPVNEVDQLKALKAYLGDRRTVGLSPIEIGGFSVNKTSWHEAGELPPVGAECEFVPPCDFDECGFHESLNSKNGTKVKILAHYSPCDDGDMVAVFSFKINGGRMVRQAVAACFRPIETEKQKTVKEISIYILSDFDGSPLSSESAAEKIYNQFIANKSSK